VHNELFSFIESKIFPGLDIDETTFWQKFASVFKRFAPRNHQLLAKRDKLQSKIDLWYKNENTAKSLPAHEAFLREIQYLVDEPASFKIKTENVDPELSVLAGPQLVVPVLNARYVLNAANARWGSLYDGFYGTDVIPPVQGDDSAGYNPKRGEKVIAKAKQFLDDYAPLASGSHKDVSSYSIENGSLAPALVTPPQFVGFKGEAIAPTHILLKHNGLHIELVIDRNHPVGKQDRAGVKDITLEAAISTIVDFEDSVAAVDVQDKIEGYRNWLGLMKGDLEAEFSKGTKKVTRRLNPDINYKGADGSDITLKGRSLLLVRNVGHLMTTNAVLLENGEEAPEGILDAILTSLISCHDLKARRNSQSGSFYIVKPKMHGPEECAFTNDLFDAVEDMLGLERNTVKVGVMDEERRTSLNLAACIKAVESRIVFINTGFLDRTGDEIRTAMFAGPMVPKGAIKNEDWISAYEARNVAIGLACGFDGKAQIGKGMWAKPDMMAEMLEAKSAHPKTGANSAWVPSPTAATLHAIHYHEVDVIARRQDAAITAIPETARLLAPPVAGSPKWTDKEVERELENNIQGILGYVVRWIDHGVGCSKVPDIHDIGLMEDRATLRISSQHVANWLTHNICTAAQVEIVFKKMAKKVDGQNANDPAYTPMAPSYDGYAFNAARTLVFDAVNQPSGYTEPSLHGFRLKLKSVS